MISIKQLPGIRPIMIERIRGASSPETLEPHRHNYYEIFWTLEGEGHHKIDFIDIQMKAREVHLIFPGQIHQVTRVPRDFYAISFKAELLGGADTGAQRALEQLFCGHNAQSHPLSLPEKDSRALSHIIELAREELQSGGYNASLVCSLMTSFLHFLTRYCDNQQPAVCSDNRVHRLLGLIDRHYHQRQDTGFYAEAMTLSNKRLNELSRQYLSKTITQLVHDRVIVEAKRELIFTDRPIKVIGMHLGYRDTAYFCRFFKRMTGASPQLFRNQIH